MAIAPAAEPLAAAPQLRSWEFDPYTSELQITVPEGTRPQYFILEEPLRIAIDIPNSPSGLQPGEENYQGIVRQIRIGQMEGGVTRIVMEFAPGAVLEASQVTLEPIGQSNRWVMRPAVALSQTLPGVENVSATPPGNAAGMRTLPALPPSASNEVPTAIAPVSAVSENPSTILNVPPPPPPPTLSDLGMEPDGSPSQISEFELPVEIPIARQDTPVVSVPPLDVPETRETPQIQEIPEPQPDRVSDRSATIATASAEQIIEFGQPLPGFGAISTQAVNIPTETSPAVEIPVQPAETEETANIPADVLLSAGTVMILSYPGSAPISVEGRSPRPEVLVVYSDVYDRNGKLIAPAGTPAIGRFVRDRRGVRFITESIVLEGRAVPLSAESDPIADGRKLLQNKSRGYTPVTTNVSRELPAAIAAKSTTIQPGQAIAVRLTEHWRYPMP